MFNFIKQRVQHLKQNRSKLFYDGAHDSYGPQKMSVSDSLQALEPRIMFDAAGVVTGAEVAADDVAQDQALTSENLEAQAVNQGNGDSDELVAALVDLVPPAGRNEIIFVDKGVEDYQTLIAGISSDAEVIFIDENSDGLEQIARFMEGRTDIDAIHIISHGDAGELRLGNATLTQESMQGEYADELQTISAAFNETADILIYGCNFAEGEKGEAAARALAEITGADVAASDDLTGAESLGGDWDLELQQGKIETRGIIDKATQANWQNVLLDTDTDGDGIVDGADLDDDNDGILDVNEPASPAITNWTAAGGANVTTSGDTLTYTYTGTNGWNSSVNSDNVSALGYSDGYEVSFTVSATTSKAFMVGLNEAGTNTTASYTDIDYAIYINGSTIRVYENGANKGTFGSFAAGDTFSIEVDGTALRYQHNGVTFRTVTITSGKDYYIDSSFNGNAGYPTYDVGNLAINALSGSQDADSDGVENRVDLDSDNDGISDLVESGASAAAIAADTNNDGMVSIAEAEAILGVGNADIDGDGLLDIFDADTGNTSAAASKGTVTVDTDSDGLKDFLDLDSDGDTIADTVESRPTAGYVANDGDVRDNDADGDGVIDMFDSNDGGAGTFGGTFTAPVDTDGDGTADYIDTDSDNDTQSDSVEAGSIGVAPSYQDPDGSINSPSSDLANEFGDTSEVAYRESVNAPVNTLPRAQSVAEDTSLLFTGPNLISVTDPNSNLASSKLTVLNGVLNVSLSGAAIISSGLNGSATLTISGNEADINATLASLSYQGNADFNGLDTLTVFSSDNTGIPLTDTDTVDITVNAVIDAVLDSFDVNENAVLNADVSSNDLHSGTTVYSVNTNASNGSVIMAANGSFSYIPNAGYNGTDSFTYDVVDGSDTETVTVSLTVNPVDDELTEENLNLEQLGDNNTPISSNRNYTSNLLNVEGAVIDAVAGANKDYVVSNRTNDFLSAELDPFSSRAEAFSVKFKLSELGAEDNNSTSALFPLRTGISESEIQDELIISSLLLDSKIFVKVEYLINSDPSLSVIETMITQLNGSPLPDWLKINDQGKLITGVLPISVEKIELRIEVKFSNDTVIIRYVDIDASTGEIASLQEISKETIIGSDKLFNNQIEKEAVKFQESADNLAEFLI